MASRRHPTSFPLLAVGLLSACGDMPADADSTPIQGLSGRWYACPEGQCTEPTHYVLRFTFVDDPGSSRVVDIGALSIGSTYLRLVAGRAWDPDDFLSAEGGENARVEGDQLVFEWDGEEVRFRFRHSGAELWLIDSDGQTGYFRRQQVLDLSTEGNQALWSRPVWRTPRLEHVLRPEDARIEVTHPMVSFGRDKVARVAAVWVFTGALAVSLAPELEVYPYAYTVHTEGGTLGAALVCVGIGTWDLTRTQKGGWSLDVRFPDGGGFGIFKGLTTYRDLDPMLYGRVGAEHHSGDPVVLREGSSIDELLGGALDSARLPGATARTICDDLGVPPPGAAVLRPYTW